MRHYKVKPIQALERGLLVLAVLREMRAASLHDLHLGTGIPKPTLTRILYEALRLVERNGRAGAIAVRLEFGHDRVDLVVRDDGVGLATREDGDGSPGAHFGLRLMQRRLEDLGGRLEIEQQRPRGLLLRATVPA